MTVRRTGRCRYQEISLISLSLIVLMAFPAMGIDEGPIRGMESRQYNPHQPITISSDLDFTQANGVTGGSGTPSDPFIISGWEFNAVAKDAITISKTTKAFVIRGCRFAALPAGIEAVHLEALSNGAVEGSLFENSDLGIKMQYVQGGAVIDNEFRNIGTGIFLNLSSGAKMYRNMISGGNYGFDIEFAVSESVIGNTVKGTKVSIYIWNVNTSKIKYNSFIGGEYGLHLVHGQNNEISYNNFTEFPHWAIQSGYTSDLTNSYHHNNFIDNLLGDNEVKTQSYVEIWDDGTEGNYWENDVGPDADSNGIVDHPHSVHDHCQDRFPLVSPVLTAGDIELRSTPSIAPLSGEAPLEVSFDASTMGGVSPYEYEWEIGDGPATDQEEFSHIYSKVGNYSVVLKVWDSIGDSWTGSPIKVTVKKPVPQLGAKLGYGPVMGWAPLDATMTLEVVGGEPPFDLELRYGDGKSDTWSTSERNQTKEHTYDKPGDYNITLNVADAGGRKFSHPKVTINVFEPLAVSASASILTGRAPLKVDLAVNISGGKKPYDCKWDFGDGLTGTGQSTTHTYSKKGTYTVSAVVKDSSAGENVTKTLTIVVQEKKSVGPPGFEALPFVLAVLVIAVAMSWRKGRNSE